MKILVCGGRNYNNYDYIRDVLDRLRDATSDTTHIIHGDADGADRLAGLWARSNGIQEVVCPANWLRHGKAAGYKRNKAMLGLQPDLVVAFRGGKGTANMILQASNAGIEVFDYQDELPIVPHTSTDWDSGVAYDE